MANVDKQTTAVDEMIAEEETKLLISLDRHFVNLGGELGVLDREQVPPVRGLFTTCSAHMGLDTLRVDNLKMLIMLGRLTLNIDH